MLDWKKFSNEEPMAKHAPMYIYATESVSEYYKALKINGKKVLTVCGSGDQVLDALFFGASDVVGFDLNVRSEYITRLKIAAIKTLSYRDFIYFFGDGSHIPSLNHDIYLKLRYKLKVSVRKFFDNAFKEKGFSGEKLARSDYFRQRWEFMATMKYINSYLLNERHYFELRDILKYHDFKFIRASITDISRKTKKKFDVINISNVPNYFIRESRRAGFKNSVDIFCRVMVGLKKSLSARGRIIYYSYSPKIYYNSPRKGVPEASDRLTLKFLSKNGGFKVSAIRIHGTVSGLYDTVNVLR